LIGAVLVGVAFGYGSRRGAFCMNSGFRGALEGDWTKVKALGLAVAVQLLALPAIFALGFARPASLPLMPLAALAGGILFGLSMRWAGGCAAGVWYKAGAGDVGALLAIVGTSLGAIATDAGPLAAARTAMQSAVLPGVGPAPPPAVSFGFGVLLLGLLVSLPDRRAGAWSWRTTGLWVGAVAAIAWPVSAMAGRQFGLAIVPGTTGWMSALAGREFPLWDSLLVLGVALGGWLAARRDGPVSLSTPGPAALLKRFVGGVGLGVGASVAGGCTVGQGLTGLALLAPSSFLVTSAIFGGSALAAVWARRPKAGASSAVRSSTAR
jgi:uncharacterized membrane protein YedE/YeeE